MSTRHNILQNLIAVLILAATTVLAAQEKQPFVISDIKAKAIAEGATLLSFKVRDTEKQSGVCPYYVETYNFDAQKKILNLKITKGFCANDQFGISQGEVYWVLPKVAQGAKVCVYLNDVKVGSLTQGNKKNYRISESCE